MSWIEDRMQNSLTKRDHKGTRRRLLHITPQRMLDSTIDFSSNDYLGLAQSEEQQSVVERCLKGGASLGATGSRLLSGDSPAFHELEAYLARVHRRPAALLFNSGYDANLSVVSSLACDTIIYDEYIHNSLHMGLRLRTNRTGVSFRHNDVDDMRRVLREQGSDRVVVLIESVYSMDGDVAPIRAMLHVAHEFGAVVVVDEAHGLGLFGASTGECRGAGVVAQEGLEEHPALLCTISTFGKAAGCHGAVVCGSTTFKDYLANFAYPFIYSTALPYHSLVTIRCSYEAMTGSLGDELRARVFSLVLLFRRLMESVLKSQADRSVYLLPSTTPIQALIVPGNERCSKFCETIFRLSQQRIRLFPIKSPTVPSGTERVRIILHAHNTEAQVRELVVFLADGLRGLRARL